MPVLSLGWRRLLAGLRLAVAALVLVAVAYQFSVGLDRPDFDAVNFFSYFTILSNLFGAVVLVLAARSQTERIEWLRGAAVVYLATTAVVFALLLADLSAELQMTTPWVNTVLHRVVPVLVVLDWLVDPPRRRFRVADAAGWLLPPLGWVAYTILRGPIAHWYPYPFIDPRPHGYGDVVVTCVVIAVGMAVLAAAVAWLGNLRTARRSVADRQ
jgi:hypothetical protein